jgi:hypothetical protein
VIARYLPDKLTPLTPAQAIVALRRAYEAVEGERPSPDCLAIHTAQSALEAARWKSLHNFCFTNAKASASYPGLFSCYKCNEKLKDGWHWYVPEGELVGGFGTALKGAPLPVPDGHPQTRFRAFTNINAGALDHMQLVRRKWPEAWTAARGGDVAGFVHGLKMRNFFTADEAPYLKGVASLMREFLPLVNQSSATPPEPPPDDEQTRCEALACVAPDPDRYLHTEAVIASMNSMGGVWDAIRNERNAAMREPD